MCLSVVSDLSKPSGREGALVPVNCSDIHRVALANNASVLRTLRRLEVQRAIMKKSDFGREQMVCGWCDPRGKFMIETGLEHVNIAKTSCFERAHLF